jgi:YHS domain-containing protein
MNFNPAAFRSIVLVLVAFLAAGAFAAPPERTLPVDPVELIAGREVPGKAELAIEREGIEYCFATPESKAAFEKEPAKYEVADGGACGRMGPLAGLGDARRYAVHDKRIYFFASDGCRAGFLKDPAKHIETDDDKVFGSNEQVTRGRAAFDKLVAWAGGAERLRAISTYRASAGRVEKQGEKEWNVANETAIAFPDRCFQKEAWNESWFSTLSGPEGAAMASTGGAERIAHSRGRAFNRSMARWPVVLLKAYVDGAPKADCPGLIVIGDGEGKLGETPVEYVKVWLNGAASRLTLDKASGRLLQLAFRGRDASMSVGHSVRTFTTYATVDGVTLPTAYSVTFNDKDLPAAAAKVDAFEINPKLAADLFQVPK